MILFLLGSSRWSNDHSGQKKCFTTFRIHCSWEWTEILHQCLQSNTQCTFTHKSSLWRIIWCCWFNVQFQVPSNFNFIQALDMYYKVHKVFNIPFHKHLVQVMSFFSGFVYRMEEDIRMLTPKSLAFTSIFDD